ncbi:hypothetical protein D9M68_691850 [compost metagenome]
MRTTGVGIFIELHQCGSWHMAYLGNHIALHHQVGHLLCIEARTHGYRKTVIPLQPRHLAEEPLGVVEPRDHSRIEARGVVGINRRGRIPRQTAKNHRQMPTQRVPRYSELLASQDTRFAGNHGRHLQAARRKRPIGISALQYGLSGCSRQPLVIVE